MYFSVLLATRNTLNQTQDLIDNHRNLYELLVSSTFNTERTCSRATECNVLLAKKIT